MTAVILAGGQCERMGGRNKAMLLWHGQPLIGHICSQLKGIFSEIILVTNHPAEYLFLGIKVVTDLIPGKGPLGGLYTGMFYARTPHIFTVACDMPFLNRSLISYLINLSEGRWDAVVPVSEKGFEPLHAVYSKKCLDKICLQIIKGDLKISSLFAGIRLRTVGPEELSKIDPELQSCLNLNTPEDLDRALSLFNNQPCP